MNSRTATFSAYARCRVELLGNHTDYNEGVVLAAAIDRGVTVKGSSRRDGLISLGSKIGRRVEVPVAHLRPQNNERWSNYPLGVVSELIAQGIPITGFSANVDGNVPAGRGLSSSAAFEVATALFLLKLFQAELPALEIAKLCSAPNIASFRSNPVCWIKSLPSSAGPIMLCYSMPGQRTSDRSLFPRVWP